jgi:rubrerythrin
MKMEDRTMSQHSLFRASEVLNMAVQIEHAGIDFYKACIDSKLNPETEAIFTHLISQEKEHAATFTRLREGLDDHTLPESYPGEMESYVKNFVKDRVFYEPEEAARHGAEISNPLEAIQFALEFEKRSILFYSSLKQLIRPSERDTIDEVIAEEHEHIRRLLSLRREVEAQNQNS